MKNFGLSDLRLVDPPEIGEEARRRAMHANDILDRARVQGFEEAIEGAALVAGTSGKTTANRKHPLRISMDAREFASGIAEYDSDVALLFGRENDGLHNDEIALCDVLVTIPSSSGYPILNLSHAALVVFYEIFRRISREGEGNHERPGRERNAGERSAAPAAGGTDFPGRELLFKNFERLLEAVRWPVHRRSNTSIMFRRIMGRAMLRPEEFHALMGVIGRAAGPAGTARKKDLLEGEHPSSAGSTGVPDPSALTEIIEGATRIIVPVVKSTGGPQSADMEVFYNPVMSFNRHVSVVIFDLLHRRQDVRRALDGLAGSGIRGCRFAVETSYEGEIILNDLNPRAAALMDGNMKLNRERTGAALVHERRDLNALMSERHFDYIDIDPFGSPACFLGTAFGSIRKGGVVAVTATDTGALAGKFKKPLLRRYGMVGGKTPCMHEIGVRSLIGACARKAAAHDKSIVPLLSHASDHYYRCYLRVDRGARKADAALANTGYVIFSGPEHDWEICSRQEIFDVFEDRGHVQDRASGQLSGRPSRRGTVIGPLWTGGLHSRETVNGLGDSLRGIMERATGEGCLRSGHNFPVKRLEKHFGLWSGECDMPPLFFHVDELARKWKASSPNMNALMEALRERGFSAARTHFEDKGIKTDASVEAMREAFVETGALR